MLIFQRRFLFAFTDFSSKNRKFSLFPTLFDFGLHVGMASQLKNELKAVEDKNLFLKNLKEQNLWSPLCFLLHDCIPSDICREMSDKLLKKNDVLEIFKELDILFKKYDVKEKIYTEAEVELQEAKECFERLDLDFEPLKPLTQYSVI